MAPDVFISLLAAGTLVGFVAGLVGIGGGVLIVPLLYLFYGYPAWSGVELSPSLQTVVSHATSLLVIVPTAIVGAWSYHRARLVDWRAVVPLAATAVLAAVVGAWVAPLLPAALLKVAFGTVLLVSAVRLLKKKRQATARGRRAPLALLLLSGCAVGFFSALLGVGGGIVAIPILIHLVGLDLKKVAATSIGIIIFTATAGVLAYWVTGRDVAGLPPGSAGYVHVAAGVPIMMTSIFTAQVGARVNQRMNTRGLRIMFAVVFLLLGLRLVLQNAAALL